MHEPAMSAILTTAIANASPLWERAESYGNRTTPLVDGIGYIIMACLLKLRAAETIDGIRAVWKKSDANGVAPGNAEHDTVISIVNHMRDYLCDACSRKMRAS